MLDDQMHSTKTGVSFYAVSSTEYGYSAENVRDTNMTNAWKPANGTADEYLTLDGGSAGWLGSVAGTVITVALAYDASGADQTLVRVLTDTADSPTGGFTQIKATFTVNAGGRTSDYVTLTIPTGGKRYYRLAQTNADRGGGTKTAKIFAWSMFRPADLFNLETDYTSDHPGPGRYTQFDTVALMKLMGGGIATNREASGGQEFEVFFDEATKELWERLRDWHFYIGGSLRAFFVQYEGLRNYAKANFSMVRFADESWSSTRRLMDQYGTPIRLRTEEW
jgi:hypothetical protein